MPAAGLVMCEFVERLLPNSDALLWNTTAGGGVYQSATNVKRREMAILAFDPLGQLRASLGDGLQQLTMIGLMDLTDKVSNLPEVYERQAPIPRLDKGFFLLASFQTSPR